MRKHLESYTCYYIDNDTEQSFPSKEEAMKAAAEYCGNNRHKKLFPAEESYIFGPGDGSTSVMVRQDSIFV